MTTPLDWRPIRHLTLDHTGAIIELRHPHPNLDGYKQLAEPFVVHTIEVHAGHTIQGHPLFQGARLNDGMDTEITVYDGDEYREHKN